MELIMADQSAQAQAPARKTRPKEFYALKINALFDEIEAIMDAKAYATEQNKKAVQLLKCSRFFILKAFGACYAE